MISIIKTKIVERLIMAKEMRIKCTYGGFHPWTKTKRLVESIKNIITQPEVVEVQWRSKPGGKIYSQKHRKF